MQTAGPQPGVSDPVGLGRVEHCASNAFPNDANTAWGSGRACPLLIPELLVAAPGLFAVRGSPPGLCCAWVSSGPLLCVGLLRASLLCVGLLWLRPAGRLLLV